MPDAQAYFARISVFCARFRDYRVGPSFVVLELGWDTCRREVHTIVPHRHAFAGEELALLRALRDAAVRPDDPMPRKPMRGREDASYEARRAGIDVAVRADEPLRD